MQGHLVANSPMLTLHKDAFRSTALVRVYLDESKDDHGCGKSKNLTAISDATLVCKGWDRSHMLEPCQRGNVVIPHGLCIEVS